MRTPLYVLLAASVLSGCFYEQTPCPQYAQAQVSMEPAYVEVTTPPPATPIVAELQPPKPTEVSIWVSGHWDWSGGQWIWIQGTWETPRAGYVWQPPAVLPVPGGRYHYHPGFWRPNASRPPRVYEDPGRVTVTVQPAPRPPVYVQPPPQQRPVYVQPPPPEHGTVYVQPPPREEPRVVVQPPPQQPPPAVYVQPPPAAHAGGSVTVEPPRNRPAPRPQEPPRNRPAPHAEPPRHGGVAVQPPPPAATSAPGQVSGSVTIQPAPGTVANGATGTVVAPPRNGGRPAPVNSPAQRPPTIGGVQPPTNEPHAGRPIERTGPATVGGATAIAGNAPTIGPQGHNIHPPAQPQLSCNLPVSTLPRSGYLTVRGTGFNNPTVTIGGTTAARVRPASATEVTVRIPNGSYGGEVMIQSGGQSAACGTLRVAGR